MANFTAYSRFDYRFFGLFSDYFDEDVSALVSGSTKITITDGYTTSILTGANLQISDNGLTGTLTSAVLSTLDDDYLQISGLSYNLNNTVYDDGFLVSGKLLFGDLADLAYMMNGNDTINGSTQSDRIAGFNGNDVINGNDGNDFLEGWDGSDTLNGGVGKDILTGGSGADKFVFNTTLNATTNLDTIKDFVKGTDKIVLDDDIFTKFLNKTSISAGNLITGTKALQADDYLIYNTSNDTLYYDADGSGSKFGLVAFAKIELAGTAAPTATDFLVIA